MAQPILLPHPHYAEGENYDSKSIFFQKCKTKHENLTNRTNIKEEH